MHAMLAPVVACCRCSVPAAAAAALLRLLQLAFRLLASAVRLVLAPRGVQHPAVLHRVAEHSPRVSTQSENVVHGYLPEQLACLHLLCGSCWPPEARGGRFQPRI